MTATKHSHRAWILVDPVQDYEESLTVLSVFGTDEAARMAARRYMRENPQRNFEAQEWRGSDLLRVWTWDWCRQSWALCYRSSISPCRYHDHAEPEAWRPRCCHGGDPEKCTVGYDD